MGSEQHTQILSFCSPTSSSAALAPGPGSWAPALPLQARRPQSPSGSGATGALAALDALDAPPIPASFAWINNRDLDDTSSVYLKSAACQCPLRQYCATSAYPSTSQSSHSNKLRRTLHRTSTRCCLVTSSTFGPSTIGLYSINAVRLAYCRGLQSWRPSTFCTTSRSDRYPPTSPSQPLINQLTASIGRCQQ